MQVSGVLPLEPSPSEGVSVVEHAQLAEGDELHPVEDALHGGVGVDVRVAAVLLLLGHVVALPAEQVVHAPVHGLAEDGGREGALEVEGGGQSALPAEDERDELGRGLKERGEKERIKERKE